MRGDRAFLKLILKAAVLREMASQATLNIVWLQHTRGVDYLLSGLVKVRASLMAKVGD